MKKKGKQKKQQSLPDFNFKEFTPEEGKIYEEAVNAFRGALAAGKTLRQAYESYTLADKDLEKLIQVDFLKIVIAERHFGQKQTLEDLAKALDVRPDILKETLTRMLQEVGATAAQEFGQQFSEVTPKTND